MIQTVDNYVFFEIKTLTTKKDREVFLSDHSYYCLSDSTPKELNVSLKKYLEESQNNTFLSFCKDKEKRDLKNSDDELVISISKEYKDNKEIYKAITGNYVGTFYIDKLKIEINSRFSNTFLERMLNFANDVFLDDVSVSGQKTKEHLDVSKYIIYYMFVQNLEKAFLLGLPKAYRTVKQHEMKLKGKVDINRFIKNDIPFMGKISSVSREQKEIQEIIDVLYKAVKIIETQFDTKNISHIKTHLKRHRSNSYVSNQTIQKAISSKALQNPIFTLYKKVLKYAKYIIDDSSLERKEQGKEQTYGFLINVAELFEIYVTQLLQKEFSDWSVSSRKEELYESQFYARKIIPDIVMEKDNNILVFDTKYKRMNFRGTKEGFWDLDRNDFFQINTYMSYYNNKKDMKLITGGLLYPIETKFDDNKCYSDNWFENDEVKFIVDGIDLSKDKLEEFKITNQDNKVTLLQRENLLDSEHEFIERITNLIESHNNE